MIHLLVCALGLVAQEQPRPTAPFTVIDLRCEGEVVPLAVPVRPSFTWRIEGEERGLVQAAWQVIVASEQSLLAPESADLWDSGRLAASESPYVVYGGRPLAAGQLCVWRARSWSADGAVSPWSEVASFEVGPLAPEDWHGARWIGDGAEAQRSGAGAYDQDPAPLLRREFEVSKPVVRARLHVSGLGICLPSLNGREVGDGPLDPSWTTFSERVFFRTFDVTDQIAVGRNCVGLELGNGWYDPLPLRMWGHLDLTQHLFNGRPRGIACLRLLYADGSVASITTGPEWRTAPGPTLFNNLYLGEVRDARAQPVGWNAAGFDAAGWRPVHVDDASLAELQPLPMPPVRVAETIDAVSATRIGADTHIVDFGQNLTGVPEVDFDVEEGTRITLRYGELLHADGTLNPMTSVCGQIKGVRDGPDGTKVSIGGAGAPEIAWQQDVYIARGVGRETYRPRFTFHGFRYMEVTGLARDLKASDCRALLLRTDVDSVGSFSCSSELLNRIQAMCRRTFLANIVGVQSDCPHRERFAYGGDIVATCEAFLMNFGMSRFYAKTVRDWSDAARPDGRLTDTAPFVGIDYCGVGWAMVHPLLLEELDRHFGDRTLLEEQFSVALRWLEVEAARREGGLVVTGLGDHEGLQRVGGAVLTTPMFVDAARRVARLGRRLGRDEASERCDGLAAESLAAWRAAFMGDAPSGQIGSGTQSELVFALGFDMLTEDERGPVLDQLRASLDAEGVPRLRTGIFGTQMLLEQLSVGGASDIALALAQRKSFPSWGWMLENDATTLWEHWEGSANTYSNNHPMFGSISAWFYRWLGGIQPAEDAVGFNRVVIRPQVLPGLDHVTGSHRSVRGLIESNWQRTESGTRFTVTIPPDTSAIIELVADAATTLTEGGRPIEHAGGVELLDAAHGKRALRVGSGTYVFELTRE